MNTGLRIALAVPAVLFLVLGAGWWIVPGIVAPQLGMTLLDGRALSSQVGDLGAFFLTLGGSIVTAVVTQNRFWLHPALMLIGLAAFGRVIAWLVHDAALAYDMLAVELPVAALLYVVSRRPAAKPG